MNGETAQMGEILAELELMSHDPTQGFKSFLYTKYVCHFISA